MKKFIMAAMCAGMVLVLSVADVSAAPKAKAGKKAAVTKEAENMQCNEVTLVGLLSEEKQKDLKDKDGKVIGAWKYYVLVDSKKKEWIMYSHQITGEKWKKLKELSGSKVKIVGMVQGSATSLLSVKTMDKL